MCSVGTFRFVSTPKKRGANSKLMPRLRDREAPPSETQDREPRPIWGASPQPRFRRRNFAVFSRNDYCVNAKITFSKNIFRRYDSRNSLRIVQKELRMARHFFGPAFPGLWPEGTRQGGSHPAKRERSILDGREATVQLGFWFADEVPFAANR